MPLTLSHFSAREQASQGTERHRRLAPLLETPESREFLHASHPEIAPQARNLFYEHVACEQQADCSENQNSSPRNISCH